VTFKIDSHNDIIPSSLKDLDDQAEEFLNKSKTIQEILGVEAERKIILDCQNIVG
jgi:hypothetical protein